MVIAMQSERAHVERQMGHFPQALALYAKTITRWQELGHRAALAHELECFAFIAIAQSQAQWAAQRAACLLGAAEALRESLDAPMRANERGQYDQNLAALHLQMDAGAFATAWAQGRSLTMEQAVQLALQEGEGVTARQPAQSPLQRG
jgi:hypothetical protein